MRLTTVLLAALVGAASAIQINPAQVNQLAAEVAAVALEHAEHAVAEESSLARSEESSARSEESSAARSEESSVAAESSESSGKALATLEADLSALLLKKDSGKFHGDDLLKLNVEIELALQKIKSIQNRDVGRGEASAPAERTVLEEVMDPILAHLATLKKHREMAGLQEIDLRDLQANMARLGGMIDDYLGGNSCGNSCGGAPAASVTLVDSCGRAVCPPKQLVEAEEVKCGSACVVASTNGCTVASTCGPTVPTIVESCNADRGACAVESKSAITTCDECAALRDSCHSQCTRWGHPTCSNSCATQTQTCHSTCVARTVRHEAIVRLVKTQVNEVCAPGNGGKCPGDVPKTVPKGTLSDHNAAKFFF